TKEIPNQGLDLTVKTPVDPVNVYVHGRSARTLCTERKNMNYNDQFKEAENLKWHPWVGESYCDHPASQRLLIVGESHYYHGNTPEERKINLAKYDSPSCTRETVEALGWGVPTWRKIPEILFLTGNINHEAFWANTAFYNFVQRPMSFALNERPTHLDFKHGWSAFVEVTKILQPSHCLFLGVTASKYFNREMKKLGVSFEGAKCSSKINRTYPRTSSIELPHGRIQIVSIKHPGKFATSKLWNEYLNDHPSGISQFFDKEKYKIAQPEA
ncbi:hypothetical protein P4E94_19375, partial [Pontiellaceae bacterium B12219]|nr:hypothetical protein [Pontiellaceae bacterium B12219]